MPGTTHMQHAQPLLLSHWLLAHGEAFQRDAERLAGAAIDADAARWVLARWRDAHFRWIARRSLATWDFRASPANSLDAVSDRDFALEYLFALSALAMHLSRLAEDFDFVRYPRIRVSRLAG